MSMSMPMPMSMPKPMPMPMPLDTWNAVAVRGTQMRAAVVTAATGRKLAMLVLVGGVRCSKSELL